MPEALKMYKWAEAFIKPNDPSPKFSAEDSQEIIIAAQRKKSDVAQNGALKGGWKRSWPRG